MYVWVYVCMCNILHYIWYLLRKNEDTIVKQAIRTSLEPHYNGKNSFYHNLIKISEYYDRPDFDCNNLSEAKIKHYICPFCPVSPCVPLSPLCPLCPLVSLVSRVSPVSICVPCVQLCPLCPLCPLFPLFQLKKKTMKYCAALPLFLIWRKNVVGFHWFHMTTFFFCCMLMRSKNVIFYENKKSKHEGLLDLFGKQFLQFLIIN